MKIVISDDEGEVYAILTNVNPTTLLSGGNYWVDDEEGDTNTITNVIEDALLWERNHG